MIKNLSICIVTNNNQDTLEECINSIKDTCSEIICTDTGSSDNTLEILDRHKCKTIPQVSKNKKDNKNNLIKFSKNDWVFFIDPNEKIINGKNEINKLTNEKQLAYSILLLQNNVLSKSIRLFNKKLNISFENPIHENIYHQSIKTSIVLKQTKDIEIENEFEILMKWKESEKLKSYPLYYESCYFIKNKKYDDFLKASKRYLFFEKNTDLPSYLMIKYYSALIYFYINKDFASSVSNIIFCLEKNPTMAEFWCLLGDINFELKKYKKAFYFYENAIILGKLRVNDDELPVDIIKYKDYPKK